MRIVWAIITVWVLLAGCKKDPEYDETVVDGITFGTYYGNCLKNCVKVYDVSLAVLQIDDSVTNAKLTWNYVFNSTRTLDKAKQNMAIPLLKQVPAELMKNSTTTFGSPDSHDQGGVYIIIKTIPAIYRFRIDMDDTPDQSAEVRTFKQRVLEVMKQIK
jgi:hypothetical protein